MLTRGKKINFLKFKIITKSKKLKNLIKSL